MKGGRRDNRREPRARINDGIRASQVRLIGPDGQQVGIVSLKEALSFAETHELDLVQVSEGDTPTCKVLNYSKYRYEQQRKEREARKKSHKQELKTLRLRPKIADHDFEIKRAAAEKFLGHGAAVQIQIVFRGAENRHPEIGARLIDRMAEELGHVGKMTGTPNREGKALQVVFQPVAQKA